MSKEINHIYEFGEFRLETAERLLLRNGQPVSLTPKAFETLLALIQSSGRVVEKDELMKRVWADAFVEEANLARNVWALRKALGDGNGEHAYIETIPKLGYRFIGPVTELVEETPRVLIQRKITARIVTEEQEIPETPLALPAKPRILWRPIALTIFVLVVVAVAGIVWFWRRSKPTIAAAVPTRNFLTDGQFDDSFAYFINARQIYFTRYITNSRSETWTMNPDGTNPHRANTEIKNLLVGTWSPDGKKVVFCKEEDPKTRYLADTDGTNEIVLPFVVGNVDWAPDSSQFVYQVRSSRDKSEIFLYTLKTGTNIKLSGSDPRDMDPSFSPDGKQIAFTSFRDGNGEIYLMATDGSNVHRLTNHPAFDNYPVFSPDGTQIAFASNREDERIEVYLKNLNDDSPPRRITNSSKYTGLRAKCWSPDGTQILLYTNQNGKDQILLANIEPYPARRLLTSENEDLNFPRLAPNGKQILYQARLPNGSVELRLMDLETKQTRLIFKTGPDAPADLYFAPAWSPDEKQIAFSNKVAGNTEIFTIRTDGSDLRNLTNNPMLDRSPIFSPDGNEIVFARNSYGSEQLYRMNLDGSNQRRLTNKTGYEMTPAFSPDGQSLAFAGDREGHGLEIYQLDFRNPNNEKLLVARRFHDSVPAFSPDGRKMAFISNGDSNSEIYVMNPDGTGLFRLTHTKTDENSPQFSKDGKSILFAANYEGRFAIYEIVLP